MKPTFTLTALSLMALLSTSALAHPAMPGMAGGMPSHFTTMGAFAGGALAVRQLPQVPNNNAATPAQPGKNGQPTKPAVPNNPRAQQEVMQNRPFESGVPMQDAMGTPDSGSQGSATDDATDTADTDTSSTSTTSSSTTTAP